MSDQRVKNAAAQLQLHSTLYLFSALISMIQALRKQELSARVKLELGEQNNQWTPGMQHLPFHCPHPGILIFNHLNYLDYEGVLC